MFYQTKKPYHCYPPSKIMNLRFIFVNRLTVTDLTCHRSTEDRLLAIRCHPHAIEDRYHPFRFVGPPVPFEIWPTTAEVESYSRASAGLEDISCPLYWVVMSSKNASWNRVAGEIKWYDLKAPFPFVARLTQRCFLVCRQLRPRNYEE